jgi:hypothetical protein
VREFHRQWEIVCALRGGPAARMTAKQRAKLLEVAMLAAEANAGAAGVP